MSKYNIYRIDHYDPVKIGRKRRIQFSVLVLFVMGTWSLIHVSNAFHSKLTWVFVLIFPFSILILILNLFKMKKEVKNIKSIGEIEFTTSLLRKRIGDSLTEFGYETIREIEIENHLPAPVLLDIRNSYFSYILRIKFTNLQSESIIISGKSIDQRKKVTVPETMKTLKKMTELKIKLP